jgi:hypothetical protein
MPLNQIQVGPQYAPDGQPTVARGNREGAAVLTELHGKYYEAALRGQLFTASTVIAGTAALVAQAGGAGTSKFGMYNPPASGRYVELVSFNIGLDSATLVVNGVGFAIQRNCAGSGGAPTSVTAIAALPLGGNGIAQAIPHSLATPTFAAIPGVTAATPIPIPFYCCASMAATSAVTCGDVSHNFDGRLILGPDTAIFLHTTVTTATATLWQLVWAEYQI